MDYNSLGEKGKKIYENYLLDRREEEFDMLLILIDERIKTLVPDLIRDYNKLNPQMVGLDLSQAENQLSNLFKNMRF